MQCTRHGAKLSQMSRFTASYAAALRRGHPCAMVLIAVSSCTNVPSSLRLWWSHCCQAHSEAALYIAFVYVHAHQHTSSRDILHVMRCHCHQLCVRRALLMGHLCFLWVICGATARHRCKQVPQNMSSTCCRHQLDIDAERDVAALLLRCPAPCAKLTHALAKCKRHLGRLACSYLDAFICRLPAS